MEHNIGFIGGGNMSTAIFQGILKQGDYSASSIWVAGPHLNNLSHWKESGANITTKNGEVFSKCSIVFLGIKPAILDQAVQDSLDTWPNDASKDLTVMVVSMLAGVTISSLHKALKILPATVEVIRIMPNTPMAVGAGACMYSPDHQVLPGACTLIEKLLSGCGLCERVPESYIDSLGALSACGPAFMYIAIEALADGAVKQGVPRPLALKFAAQMVVGSGQMVLKSGKHPGLLKDEVCSPGGSTICGVAALENGKLRATLINAIEASTLRTKEMGSKAPK